MRFPPASSVAHWLQLRGFAVLAPLFEAHEIDMEVLPQLTGEDLEDMGLADFRTRIELLVHVTQECNSRAMDEVDADLDAMTEKQGERLAGVRETTLAVEVEEAAEDEAAAEEGEEAAALLLAGRAEELVLDFAPQESSVCVGDAMRCERQVRSVCITVTAVYGAVKGRRLGNGPDNAAEHV